MDYTVLKGTLEAILDETAFKQDESEKNISILGKAQEDLKAYLEENTSISDDEKAKRFSEFLTNTITNVTTQAIMVAGQAPLQEAQIVSIGLDDTNKSNESVQKVISMQNDDKAKLNNSAVNVAKAKAEIETLIPAQVLQITGDIAYKEALTLLEGKKLDIADKDILIKAQEVLIKEQSLEIDAKKLDLMDKDILIKEKEVAIKEAELPLKEALADVEVKRLDVMTQDILTQMAQVDLDEARLPLLSAQVDNEKKQLGLTEQQIRVSATEVQYKLAQLKAIQKASEINQKIEEQKNITQIKIAKIHAS